MSDLLRKLGRNAQKGSKPRCHWLTHGTPQVVAARLTALIEPWGTVSVGDAWMPNGFENTAEAQLHQTPQLLSQQHCNQLRDWWLAVPSGRSTTPNFDLAFKCDIAGATGICIVEAKAHNIELEKEIIGKNIKDKVTANGCRNHARIACCIQEANYALMDETKHRWALSHEWCYQMSNRFTWAWKLAELGYPVIVVYLGFLNAEEMRSGKKQRPLTDHQDWSDLVTSHSAPLFPDGVWNQSHPVHGQKLIPIIRSMQIPYDKPCDECGVNT